MIVSVVIIVITVLMSAFFSGSETAIVSCSRVKVRSQAKAGSFGARVLENLLESPEFFFSIVLVGTNLAIIACTAEATSLAIKFFGNAKGPFIATAVMTPLLLIFGEVVPKSAFLYHSDRVSIFVAPILRAISYILWPLIKPMAFLAEALSRLTGKNEFEADFITTREELIYLYRGGREEEDIIAERELRIIDSVFRFGVVKASDLMLPISEVVTFPYNASISQVVDAANKYPFSNYPLVSPDSGMVVGVISLFDLLGMDSGEKLTSLMHKPFLAREDELAEHLIVRMKGEPLHLAIVVDPKGNPKGIVTLENIIENIVGDIASEYE